MKIEAFPVSMTAPHRYAFVDVTQRLVEAVAMSGIEQGSVTAHCLHTTCALLLNEWEDGAQSDLLARLESLVPAEAYYAHDDFERRTQNMHPNEPINGRAHVVQMLLGAPSVTMPVVNGAPLLGQWQRLMFLELDAPKPRSLMFQTWGLERASNVVGFRAPKVAASLEDVL